jgi:hypothetical protein
MLRTSLETLAATPPPRKLRHLTYPQARHREMELSRALGRSVDPNIEYNVGRANARVHALEQELAARTTTAPATATPTAPVTTAGPESPVSTQGNVRSARDFLAMSDRDRAEFCQAGGSLTRADFNSLTPRMTMVFCSNGGRIVNDVPNQVRQPGGGAPKE